jgi:hypothetical protein
LRTCGRHGEDYREDHGKEDYEISHK